MSRHVRGRIQAFVDTYSDDSVQPPPRAKRPYPSGPDNHNAKVTHAILERLAKSNARGVDLAREFSVNPSTITRWRKRLAEAG